MAVPNAAVSAAGLGAAPETEPEVVGGPGVSTATGTVLGRVAAAAAVGPGAERAEAGEAGSDLTSGPAVAAGVATVASTASTVGPPLDTVGPGLLTAGWARAGSFLTESEVCGGAWGSGTDCGCPRSEVMDAEASPLSGFSDGTEDTASSVLLPEATGRVGADAELRRLPSDIMGNKGGRGAAVVAEGGAGGGAVLPVCWFPKAKPVLLPLRESPPKLTTPEEPALARGRVPKMPAAELLVLVPVAAASGAPVVVAAAAVGGSACFPSTGGLVKPKPEGAVEVLVGCALVRPAGGAFGAGFVESSAWPTRSPEKLPRVSPAKELGNRSSPNLDGGVSSLLEVVGRAIPEGATGLLLEGAGSAGGAAAVAAAPAVVAAVIPERGGELSGTVS